MCKHKPKLLTKFNLVQNILQLCFNLAIVPVKTTPNGEEEDEPIGEDPDDELRPKHGVMGIGCDLFDQIFFKYSII